jgi:galactose mutarotase-like enzyme
MTSQKRYTTQTFTKRVDHDGGEHSQLLKGTAATCKKCGAVYSDHRWYRKRATASRNHFASEHPLRETICPACIQIANRIVGGYVSIDGKFVNVHRREIAQLLKNEEKHAIKDNPLSRVISWVDGDNKISIETTTEHLAARFGRAVEKAYDGDLTYDFAHENKVARIYWHRD